MNKSISGVLTKELFYALLLIGICNSSTYADQNQMGDRDDSHANKITVSKEVGRLIGGMPMMLSVYNEKGTQTVGLSGDYHNTLIDISAFPIKRDPWKPKLAQQEGRSQYGVSLRRRHYKTAFIDKKGIVFPGDIKKVSTAGPYVDVTFLAPKTEIVIPLKGLNIKVSSKSKGALEIVRKKHEIIEVRNVPNEPLDIEVIEEKSGKKWSSTLFPMYRGAVSGAIFYYALDVPLGERRKGDPNYDD